MKNHQKGLVILLAAALFFNSLLGLGQQPARSQGEANPKRESGVNTQSGVQANIEGTTESQTKAKIDFVAPVAVEDALVVAASQNLTITQIQHSFMVGDQKFVGLYPVYSDTNPHTIAVSIVANYRGFLEDISNESNDESIEAGQPDRAADQKRQKVRAQTEEALIRSYQNEFRVDGIIVLGTQSQFDAIKESSPLISEIEISSSQQSLNSVQQTANTGDEPQATTSVDEKTWVPVSGKITTDKAAEGGRYVKQEMRWSNVSGFGSNSTYEHDFFLKNSAGEVRGAGTYLNRSETLIDSIPKVEYATSNLPYWYLDSRAFDGNDEIAFTIGCAKAIDIKANETYTSYIRTKDGDATQDDGKLQAQLGHRTPSWCYDTLCSFEDKDVQRVVIVGAWEVPVPGVKSWDRTVGPAAHFSMNAQNKSVNDSGTLNLSVPVNGNVPVSLKSTSSQGSAAITKFVWKSNGAQICTNSSTCSYNFGTASNTITLTVTDSNGKSSTATGLVKLSFQTVGPTAHFSMSAQNKSANDGGTLSLSVPVNGNVTVSFKSTSSQGSAAITKYVWKSNGTQICTNSSTCSYKFGTASNTITLTITDSNGKSSTATGLVKLSFQTVGPTAHFSMSAQNKSANDGGTLSLSVPVNGNVTVSFKSTSSQGSAAITKYVWKSNGTQICTNSSTCSYKFGTASNTITLTITDSNNKSATTTGLVKLK